jgi:hypothetical protein
VIYVSIEKIKRTIYDSTDEIFHKLHEIWDHCSRDIFHAHEAARRLDKLRKMVNDLRPKLEFVNPPEGRFWSQDILKNGNLKEMHGEVARMREQIESLRKSKQDGIQSCSDELKLLEGFENSLVELSKGLARVNGE